MKILMIDPGADTSTVDVFDGYRAALVRAGHEVAVYSLTKRIGTAGAWLDYNFRRSRRNGLDVPKPTSADTGYWAGIWSLEMALRLMPDWIIVVSGMFLLKDLMTLLRKATWPHSKLALLGTESPYDDDVMVPCLPLFDAVTTNEVASVEPLRRFNPATCYLPHAYDPTRHRPDLPIPGDTPAHDVVFVGSGFRERVELLAAVDWSGIDLGLYGNWEMLGSRSKLRRYVRGGQVDNDRAAELYRAAKIGLNLHRTRMGHPSVPIPPGQAESLNPRAYELAACRVFQLCDERAEAGRVFGETLPIFTGPAALQAHLRYALDHPAERALYAQRQYEAIIPHTYDARASRLLEVLGERARAA